MRLSDKQKAYWRAPFHRWNIKHGATRSGKTWLDFFMIPRRIQERRGKDGLVALLGNTRGTLQRNIIEPMQAIYGAGAVSSIRTDGTALIFGKRVHCLGADSKRQVDRLRGMGIKYCYGDEVVSWEPGVFEMLKSRLDKPYSCFDGTCNPEHGQHWLKKFIDGGGDVFAQHYTLDDNPFLDPAVATGLKREYAGTVYYERYILGRWVRAEGAIYGGFAADPEKYLTHAPDDDFIQLGVDFGGSKSAFAFVASGLKRDGSKLTALCSELHPAKDVTPERMYDLFDAFVERVECGWGEVEDAYCDSAEQTLMNGLRGRARVAIRNSLKRPIMDRVRAGVALIGGGRFFYTAEAESLRDALCGAVYDRRKMKDERLDDGSCDIDSLDAWEYSWERYMARYMRYAVGNG